MSHSLTIALYLLGSYLLGSLPFGLWIAWQWKHVDIRTVGSGNIGSTNVFRICGPIAGTLVFALDMLKGLLPPLVGRYLLHLEAETQWLILSGLLGIVGHNFSVWLGFKGGKGIATSAGVLIGICPWAALGVVIVFFVTLLLFRWVSLGSLMTAVTLPIFIYFFYPKDYYLLAFGLVAGVMAIYRHRGNIQRLFAGTEPKVNLFKRKSDANPPGSDPEDHTSAPSPEAPQ
ncbi:MAG TPA: glycerol-3-phosphate 1-O-acyltransferase PlsY [Chthonomonadaceae bacterium]|nr:glycerol-3-phosphate 1-O-acyltransferase PlsY [Chthonomonadaceae bacterium]